MLDAEQIEAFRQDWPEGCTNLRQLPSGSPLPPECAGGAGADKLKKNGSR
jgi:hypothetical protein